jgi:hypothetical protein
MNSEYGCHIDYHVYHHSMMVVMTTEVAVLSGSVHGLIMVLCGHVAIVMAVGMVMGMIMVRVKVMVIHTCMAVAMAMMAIVIVMVMAMAISQR